MNHFRAITKTAMLAGIALAPAAGIVQAGEVRTFPDLPPAIRKHVLTGVPRLSLEIPDNLFGTPTTFLAESCGKRMEETVRALS